MIDFIWDMEAPLNREKGETKNANIALIDYYQMGPRRSLRKLLALYNKQATDTTQTFLPPTTKWSTLAGWSFRYQWQARVAAQKVIDDAEREALWAARRIEVQEYDWQMSGELRKVALKILEEAPIFVKQQRRFVKGEGDRPDREIITMALNGQLGVKAAETASKLGRLAAEMENDRQKIVLAMEKEVEGLLDVAQDVLDERSYQRLIAALSGEAGGEAAPAETETETDADDSA